MYVRIALLPALPTHKLRYFCGRAKRHDSCRGRRTFKTLRRMDLLLLSLQRHYYTPTSRHSQPRHNANTIHLATRITQTVAIRTKHAQFDVDTSAAAWQRRLLFQAPPALGGICCVHLPDASPCYIFYNRTAARNRRTHHTRADAAVGLTRCCVARLISVTFALPRFLVPSRCRGFARRICALQPE